MRAVNHPVGRIPRMPGRTPALPAARDPCRAGCAGTDVGVPAPRRRAWRTPGPASNCGAMGHRTTDRGRGSAARARRAWAAGEPLHALVYFAPEVRAASEAAGLRGFWRGYFALRA